MDLSIAYFDGIDTHTHTHSAQCERQPFIYWKSSWIVYRRTQFSMIILVVQLSQSLLFTTTDFVRSMSNSIVALENKSDTVHYDARRDDRKDELKIQNQMNTVSSLTIAHSEFGLHRNFS